MLWLDLIDIIYFVVGGFVGAFVMAALTVSKCDDCRSRRYFDE